MSAIHDYPVSVHWSGGRGGSGRVKTHDGHVSASLAVPEEFKGPGGAANPEQILTCAVAACYGITFGIIAENRHLPVESLEVEVIGHVEVISPLPVYNAITIKATIRATKPNEEQRRLILEMAHKADSYCIVTNTLRDKVNISVEATIVEV